MHSMIGTFYSLEGETENRYIKRNLKKGAIQSLESNFPAG